MRDAIHSALRPLAAYAHVDMCASAHKQIMEQQRELQAKTAEAARAAAAGALAGAGAS